MTDAEQWKHLKKGNRDALQTLFCRYYDDLFRYAVKFCGSEVVAEDHIQDLFLRIWKNRETLGNVTGVKTYLWTALRRSLISESNRVSRKSEIYEKFGEENPHMEFGPEEIILQDEKNKEKRAALKTALDELTPRQREIIYLRFYEGMTYEEVQEITSLNYQTLRNYVHESLKLLDAVIKSPTAGMMLPILMMSQW